ncbi:MAG: hypothetical protein ACKO7A_01770, partial [Microcystis sp.]
MSESVYIETSIFGHLTARPTENLILAANIKRDRRSCRMRPTHLITFLNISPSNKSLHPTVC